MADGSVDSDRLARLRLIRSTNIGPVSYGQLIERFGGAAAAIEAIPMLAARGGGRAPTIANARDVEAEIARVARLGARHVFAGDRDYPALLAQIETAPPVLTMRGDGAFATRTVVAIVGARNASAAACRFARGLAADLCREGVSVVSGLARGIDTAAHVGSIDGGTIAVIAGGIDVAYPPENAGLQDDIAARGLLIAEQPPGIEPRARHFPYRNRIIAGLAVGTVVIEAAPKSGSLITARLANEAGREVMAVPGSPIDPRARGCNALIREGATLVQSAADVLETIRPLDARIVAETGSPYAAPPPLADASDRDRETILDLLGPSAVPVDEIVRQSRMPAAIVQMVLLELELGRRLERHAGGKVSLC